MATAVEQAKREQTAVSAEMLGTDVIANASASSVATAAITKASGKLAGVDAQDFVAANRIHIKHGSLFIDPYLVIHPRELAPENEAQLRQKLKLTYSINNPSFYESYDRLSIALNLGQLVPISLTAKHSKLIDEVKKFNAQVASGIDTDMQRQIGDKHHPFTAIVRDTLEHPSHDPVGMETLKNGLALYLLVREKLTKNGYLNKLSDYVLRSSTPDQVLSDLSDKIGVSPLALRDAAAKGGIDAVGDLLGLEKDYVKDVKTLTEQSAASEFGYNRIEHWHLGRQRLGISAPIEQKIARGMEERINAKINDYRARVRHYFEVPEPIKAEQQRIADALNYLEPIQRATMFKLGYEIGYTPEFLADEIAFHRDVFGLHRKTANDLRDVNGTYRIYFSGHGDLKASYRTLVHEVAHNLWPDQFTAEDVKKIDALATSDGQRFKNLNRFLHEQASDYDKLLHAYRAGNAAEKKAVAQTLKERAQPYGIAIDEAVLPYLRDAKDLRFMVTYAMERLSIDGAFYNKSGYVSPHERFREVLSRFAEYKQVEYRSEPQLLHFIAPGLDQVWESHYIPHLKRVYQKLEAMEQKQAANQPAIVTSLHATTENPKVANRPVEVQACAANTLPQTTIDAATIHNEQTLAAVKTLGEMGVQAYR